MYTAQNLEAHSWSADTDFRSLHSFKHYTSTLDISNFKLYNCKFSFQVSRCFLVCVCAILCLILFLKRLLELFISFFVLAWVLYCPALCCLVCSFALYPS